MSNPLLPLSVAILMAAASHPATAQMAQTAPEAAEEAIGPTSMATTGDELPAPSDVKTVADFVVLATMSNNFEIQSSNLALQKAQNQNVTAFAKRMLEDHSNASMALKQAVEESEDVDAVPTGLTAHYTEMVRKLEAVPAEQFDAPYLEMQEQAHRTAITLFQTYSENGEEGPIQRFASETLPVLKQHLAMLEDME
ncbi:DUF4142 domain-containing protein [Jiella marina]|uniref:DUF4142 domain-containing protein n=1 Tax=Jiella sp. LLJ827 TaxID=2917712 RepID=UPI0021007AAE|nr:DUF4142 domain-containing protein [Jiella sp. LLJ827]MCQ0987429.1 DUF4142 domain-containing protein [Jiella sp. LLJ827]